MDERLHSRLELRGYLLEPDTAGIDELRVLGSGVGVVLDATGSPGALLDAVAAGRPDFVLLCSDTTGARCIEVLRSLSRHDPVLPLLAILPQGAGEAVKTALLRAGASDFFVRPFGAEELRMRLRNALRLSAQLRPARPEGTRTEDEIRDTIGEVILRELETLQVLGKAAEFKDQETGMHIVRVAHYAQLIARMIGLDRASQEILFHASALHDVGKIGIPDNILLKPARLSAPEYRVMQTHTTNGHGILEKSQSSYLLTGALIALTHHERFDGTGYPMGIRAEEIPLYGRIVCVADVFDALTSRRPYKQAWPIDQSLEQLRRERGTQFDPVLVDAFCAGERTVEQIHREHREPPAPEPPRTSAQAGA